VVKVVVEERVALEGQVEEGRIEERVEVERRVEVEGRVKGKVEGSENVKMKVYIK
jgi:cytoskeletal protein CcmA (bactofilin family)